MYEIMDSRAGYIVVLVFYFIPAIVAAIRRHHNAMAIGVLNLFGGWTVVGWLIALVWAFTSPPRPR